MYQLKFVVIVILFKFVSRSDSCDFKRDEDENRNACQLIESRGFICETHRVVTKDGYILSLKRIVHPDAVSSSAHLDPVLLGHGIFVSSTCWLISAPGGFRKKIGTQLFNTTDANNLSYALANQGWDVWLTNSRGTTYSTANIWISPSSGRFWQFSFDEMAAYDTPAFIDYILKVTDRQSLAYVGHSQGTTIMTGLLATNPEYSEKIKPYIALAPIAYVGNLASPIRILADVPNLYSLVSLFHGPFGNDNPLVKLLIRLICNPVDVTCSSVLLLSSGVDPKHELNGRIHVYAAQADVTSVQDIIHYAQNINDKNFEFYTPQEKNILNPMGLLDQLVPDSVLRSHPKTRVYPLENINSTEIHLINSCDDLLSVPEDVDRMVKALKVKPKTYCTLKSQNWNHYDHLWACDVWKENGLVYDILEKYRTGRWKSSLGYSSEEEELTSLCRPSCPSTNTVSDLFKSGDTPKVIDALNDVLGGFGLGALRSLNLKTLLNSVRSTIGR